MTEHRKLALVLFTIVFLGLIMMAFEMLWQVGRRWVAVAIVAILAVVILGSVIYANARDLDGRYAKSPLRSWFDNLRSGKGLCCSDADGFAVKDVDWETKDGRYRVFLEGEWIDVPPNAVITEPNRAGRTMVWPIKGSYGIDIICFMPGPMT